MNVVFERSNQGFYTNPAGSIVWQYRKYIFGVVTRSQSALLAHHSPFRQYSPNGMPCPGVAGGCTTPARRRAGGCPGPA